MPETNAAPAVPAWIARSNHHAQVVLEHVARLYPETGSMFGVPGADERVIDLGTGIDARRLASMRAAEADLMARLEVEHEPQVKQDLAILLESVEREIETHLASEALLLPYVHLPETIYRGLRTVLDHQNPPARQRLGLPRLRRYAGLEPGTTAVHEQAIARWREKAGNAALVGPARAEVEKNLADAAALLDGLQPMFDAAKVTGYESSLEQVRAQMAAYADWVRAEVLPRARADYRQPGNLYAIGLRNWGVDMPLGELTSRARTSFREIQNEMGALAPLVAREQGFVATDYRDVLARLKQKQFAGDAILPHYESRMKDLEAIIVREGIVTLPARAAQIRLATPAETAAQPAPHMQPPRLIGNQGERGTFVLPLAMSASPGQAAAAYDDFTFEAASWTLTAHEGRPGHELQFAALVEHGVSIARALFAFNSVNVEGWALYTEAECKPYEPLDGQLVALQHRLMRAARAFLDPAVQARAMTPDEAKRVLMEDVVLSEAMARQEIERYMFRAPGQATSYFCGYQRLIELRCEAEHALGARFDRRRYHDFVLAQGLLPPTLLKRAVLEQFVPAERAR